MSFDLGVWSSNKRITDEQAGTIYERLCEEGKSSRIEPQPDARERIVAFLRELEERYPPIGSDAWDDDTTDDCPWSCDFDVSDVHVIMACKWSRADEIQAFVEALAFRHELLCYDPQSDVAHLPAVLGGIRRELSPEQWQALDYGRRREAKQANLRAVEETLDRSLGTLGFEKRSVRVPGGFLKRARLGRDA